MSDDTKECPKLAWRYDQDKDLHTAYSTACNIGWSYVIFYNGTDWEIQYQNSSLLDGFDGDRLSSDTEILKAICQDIEDKAFAAKVEAEEPETDEELPPLPDLETILGAEFTHVFPKDEDIAALTEENVKLQKKIDALQSTLETISNAALTGQQIAELP